MLLIILLIILLFVWYINVEQFQNLNFYPSKLFGMRKFGKMKGGKIISLDIKPIVPSFGESQCDIVQCPPHLSNDMTCYRCF